MPCQLFSERSIRTIMRVGSRTTFWIYIQWIELVIQVSHWLSFSLIWLVDLDFNLRSYRTDDYVPRLFFESSRAQNFNETWVVKLSISSVDHSPTNPTALLNRSISFQLIMKSRPNQPKEIHFMVVRAPGSDFQVWIWPLIWEVIENCTNVRLPNDLWWPFFLSWTIWPICIDSQQTTLRRHTSLYLYPAQQKLIEWLDQETFIFEFTFFNIINMKTEKVDETHVTKGVHRVGGTDLELTSTTNFNFDSIYS